MYIVVVQCVPYIEAILPLQSFCQNASILPTHLLKLRKRKRVELTILLFK